MRAPRIDKSALPIGVTQRRRSRTPGMSQKHLDWLKTLPSIVSGIEPCGDAHHLLGNLDGLPKGMGRTNKDKDAVPVTRAEHEAAHASGDDEKHFRDMGLDARAIAAALWRVSGDTAAGMRIIHRARLAAGLIR
jgi:hypothetical protein